MFCVHCGAKLADQAQFCHNCGAKLFTDQEIVNTSQPDPANHNANIKEALIRKAYSILEKWDFYPQMPLYTQDCIAEFNSRYIQNFDPLYRLPEYKQAVLDTCMEATAYQYDQSFFDDVIQEVYTKHEKNLMITVVKAIAEDFQERIRHYTGSYSDLLQLRREEYDIFLHMYCIINIACKAESWDYLFVARQGLRMLSNFQCQKNTGNPIFQIKGNGRMFSLVQFQKDYQLYRQWMNFIEIKIHQNGSEELKAKLTKVKKEEESYENKKKRKTAGLVLLKVLACVLQPLLCIAVGYLSVEMDLPQDLLPEAVVISMLAIILLSIVTNIKAKHPAVVIIFLVLYSVLFYPLCLLMSYAMAIVVLFVIICAVGLFRFIKS